MTASPRREWLLSDRPASRRQARLGQAYRTWLGFRGNWLAMVGLGVVVLLILLAIFADVIAPFDPVVPGDLRTERFLPPGTGAHLLGTDDQSRDIFSRIVYGSRLTLMVVALVSVIATPIGMVVGTTAGYFGGWVDAVLMRFTELFQAIPGFAFAVVVVAIFQPTVVSIVVAIALVSWPPVARLVRSEFMTLRQREFVQAALLAGQSSARIIFTQVLPNAVSPIVVMGSLMVASSILLESALSFLGLGDPNMMSWGFMVGAARTALRQAWWIAVFPGVAIALTVLALNLVGEGLSDGLNTRLDGRLQ